MSSHQLLYLDDDRLTAYRFSRDMPRTRRFDASPAGFQDFAGYLGPHRHERFTLLANLAEEEFRIAVIPALRGHDRESVLARRLAQAYPETPFAGSQSLGHERTRRREERVLLAALAAPERIAPWLACLHAAGAAVAGIHTLPFLGPRLLARLRIRDAHCLLFTLQDDSLRESYIAHGRLVFSRRVPRSADDAPVALVATESAALQRYLIDRRLLADDVLLRIVAVIHPRHLPASGNDAPCAALTCVSTDECARRTGCAAPTDDRIDALYAHLALSGRPTLQFAAPALRHGDRCRRLQHTLRLAAATTLAAGIALGGQQLAAAASLSQTTDRLRSETLAMQQRLAERGTPQPMPPEARAARQRIVDRHATLLRTDASPAAFYGDLGRILGQAPAIRIETLDWQAASPEHPGEAAILHGSLDAADETASAAGFAGFLAALDESPTLAARIERPPQSGRHAASDDAHRHTFALHLSRQARP